MILTETNPNGIGNTTLPGQCQDMRNHVIQTLNGNGIPLVMAPSTGIVFDIFEILSKIVTELELTIPVYFVCENASRYLALAKGDNAWLNASRIQMVSYKMQRI